MLYLVRGLLNVLQTYMWDVNSDAKAEAYMHVLCLLSTMAQDTYPYHTDKIDSNDKLYGSDPKYIAELEKLSGIILEEILHYLQEISDQPSRQGTLALELFNVGIGHGDLVDSRFATLLGNLWHLAGKQGQAKSMLMLRTSEYVKLQADGGRPIAKELLRKIF